MKGFLHHLAIVGWWLGVAAFLASVAALVTFRDVPAWDEDAKAQQEWQTQDEACWADPDCDPLRWEHLHPEPGGRWPITPLVIVGGIGLLAFLGVRRLYAGEDFNA